MRSRSPSAGPRLREPPVIDAACRTSVGPFCKVAASGADLEVVAPLGCRRALRSHRRDVRLLVSHAQGGEARSIARRAWLHARAPASLRRATRRQRGAARPLHPGSRLLPANSAKPSAASLRRTCSKAPATKSTKAIAAPVGPAATRARTSTVAVRNKPHRCRPWCRPRHTSANEDGNRERADDDERFPHRDDDRAAQPAAARDQRPKRRRCPPADINPLRQAAAPAPARRARVAPRRAERFGPDPSRWS